MEKFLNHSNFVISLKYSMFPKNQNILCRVNFLGYPWDHPYPDIWKIAMYRILFVVYPHTNTFYYVPLGRNVELGNRLTNYFATGYQVYVACSISVSINGSCSITTSITNTKDVAKKGNPPILAWKR